MKQFGRTSLLLVLAIVATSIAAFWTVGSQGFVGLDVDDYLLKNPTFSAA